ncbi:MAG: DUF4426 domain-containing protein [Spongiibacteraceae bacterium]
MHKLRYLLLTVLLCGVGAPLQAISEEPPATPLSAQFGDDSVYFSVLNTSFLSPQVASTYGVVRGKNKFLINVAIRREEAASNQAVQAKVSGTTSDLIYVEQLKFREIVEQTAIYYIAEFSISNDERRVFRLHVDANKNRAPYDINFNKMLYVDK